VIAPINALVVPDEPDAPLGPPTAAGPAAPSPSGFAEALSRAVEDAAGKLDAAAAAERAFAAGRGGLQEMVLARAQADVTLSLAAAAASRTNQALSTILGMQV
jgi:flagellar hook-basal body complex protein FliE